MWKGLHMGMWRVWLVSALYLLQSNTTNDLFMTLIACVQTGRLGLGHEDDVTEPCEVQLPVRQQVVSVVAGPDCTFLITKTGKVLACGNNGYNKLGLNSEVRGVTKRRAKVSEIGSTFCCCL